MSEKQQDGYRRTRWVVAIALAILATADFGCTNPGAAAAVGGIASSAGKLAGSPTTPRPTSPQVPIPQPRPPVPGSVVDTFGKVGGVNAALPVTDTRVGANGDVTFTRADGVKTVYTPPPDDGVGTGDGF